MASDKMDESVAAAAEAAVTIQNPDKLAQLRTYIADARDLEFNIKELQASMDILIKQLFKLRSETLPTLFEELGVNSMTLEASGNLPAYVAKLTTQYSASLPKDEREGQAYQKIKWLRELAKNTYTIFLDKGDTKKAKALEAALKKAKVEYENKISVHSSTLTAEIRRRFESGHPLPPADLDLLGAFVRPLVKLDQVKEKL